MRAMQPKGLVKTGMSLVKFLKKDQNQSTEDTKIKPDITQLLN